MRPVTLTAKTSMATTWQRKLSFKQIQTCVNLVLLFEDENAKKIYTSHFLPSKAVLNSLLIILSACFSAFLIHKINIIACKQP